MHDAYTPLVFYRHSLRLRALMVDNQPWFVTHDFARLIGHPDAAPCRDVVSYEGRRIGVVRWQGEVWVAWRDLPAFMTSGKEVSA
ncbi:hypothetical protein [Pseudomonas sp. TCU-HL1]|uniref:hypothetical protein n=1 Tax=Pseudomonas sp. TCU-HL1 TaxID=1856685 RepID=UPI00083DE51C|nr:hypothetical protein [Pseudomonas sp. TCU-HL1]AOE83969.1 hypothetical protein THL1_1421 [Pseudomonas sp. TCU-HL1]